MEKSTLFIIGAILLSGMMISTSVLMSGGNMEARIAAEVQRQIQGGGEEPELVQGGDLNLAIADNDPYEGDMDTAEFAIVEFSDYECPFCKRFHEESRTDLLEKYVATGQAVMLWKDLPLPFHDPLATQQARAAHCVYNQVGNDGFFAYGDAIFDTTDSGIGMEESELFDLAENIEGLNQGEFKNCYDNEDTAEKVASNMQDAETMGVNGTPGILVGRVEDGQVVDAIRLAGALPIATFEQVIEDYLK